MSFLKNETTKKFIVACFYIILGILLCVFPQHVQIFICYLFGGILIFSGALRVFGYYLSPGMKSFVLNGPTNGFISILFGAFFIIFSKQVLAIYPIVIGVFLALKGIGKLIKAYAYKSAKVSSWWFDLIIGIILLILGGTLIIADATISGNVIVYITGASLIVQGIILIVTMIYLSYNLTEIQKIFKDNKNIDMKQNDDDVIDV